MIKINLVAVGRIKEKYFKEGIEEYKKRLAGFCQFTVIEVEEENYKTVSPAVENIIKEKEAERILPHLKGAVYALAIEGKKLSSTEFSGKLKKAGDEFGVITFVIGGSYGLSDRVKKAARELISFSDMTFPHTLFRLLFTEQIYRAFCIINGNAYHK